MTATSILVTTISLAFLFACNINNDNSDNEPTPKVEDPTPPTLASKFEVTTLSTGVAANGDGVSVAANGDIYISGGPDARNITRVTPEGNVSVFATGFESANGSYFDSQSNLYVADYQGNAIRKIEPDGTFSTFASDLNGPGGVYVDHEDNVIIGLFGANFSGTAATVLKITPDGTVSELATGGGLNDVVGVAGDGNGRIFAANWSTGELFEVTGGEVKPFVDIEGTVNQIEYADGYIYVPNPEKHKILRVDLNGNVEEIAGTGEAGSSDGPAKSATFNRPNSSGLSPDGQILYVYDANTGHVRQLSKTETE